MKRLQYVTPQTTMLPLAPLTLMAGSGPGADDQNDPVLGRGLFDDDWETNFDPLFEE